MTLSPARGPAPELGLLPAHAVAAELGDGSLVEVGVSPARPGLVLRAMRAPGHPASTIVDALLDSVRDALSPAS